jgi:hypothetical protein
VFSKSMHLYSGIQIPPEARRVSKTAPDVETSLLSGTDRQPYDTVVSVHVDMDMSNGRGVLTLRSDDLTRQIVRSYASALSFEQ